MTFPLIIFFTGCLSVFIGMNIAANAQVVAKKHGVPIKPGHVFNNWMQLHLIFVLKEASKKDKVFEKYYIQYIASCIVTIVCMILWIALITR